MKKNGEIKVCLVGSSGGHLTHLYMLKPFWKDKNRFWVTFDKEDARSLLEGEKVYPCYFPTNRSIKALIKNAAAWKSSGRELHKTPVSAEGKGLLWLLPEIDEISCSQET